ncbi:hypothetical protein FMM05_11575 [Flavobacterium zepuense]|uniref:Leucine-rich repeat domain-containing protein n=1 Tax=Flavobacterium zepuense TaxID=2593302 RepID=A0A552V000_9FLAO|nr:hypothetical protein [Flavobacterium zepuense]TRW23799.1 hypothetical protein FMM05_11575 [Flavobacterium zepuense]
MNNIEFESGTYGTKAVIRTAWDESFFQVLMDKNVVELELNDGKGWRGDSVDFLRSFPQLKALTLFDFKIKSISAIHHLNELIEIKLSTYSDEPVDFSLFPNLRVCSFEWIKGSTSLFNSTGLTSLFINSFNEKSSVLFSKLINLEQLAVLNAPVENINGFFTLTKLKYLRIANLKKITSVEGIAHLQQLEKLEIHSCKGINNVSEIFTLTKLKHLFLLDIGNIASIKGIEHLSDLRDFIFYESTNVLDGDISPVLKLKNLTKISYQNRKHYTHKREEFGKMYFQ